jgi:hypothetical protein
MGRPLNRTKDDVGILVPRAFEFPQFAVAVGDEAKRSDLHQALRLRPVSSSPFSASAPITEEYTSRSGTDPAFPRGGAEAEKGLDETGRSRRD